MSHRGFLADSSAVTDVARGADGSLLGVAVGTTERHELLPEDVGTPQC